MTAAELIARADALRANHYPESRKLSWLQRLDGQINSVDSNLLKRIVANTYKVEAGSVAQQAADLDSNGTINAVDSNLLKRKLLS